jgi:hypothetical protein
MIPKEVVEVFFPRAPFTLEERDFLRRLVAPHVTYYETLAGNPNSSAASREKLRLIKALWDKLS